jgi:endonuclease/exonuclease/phosphatase family metal-dependent hydrolase
MPVRVLWVVVATLLCSVAVSPPLAGVAADHGVQRRAHGSSGSCPTVGRIASISTSSGRFGSGMVLGELPTAINASTGPAVTGQISTAVANIPSRTSDAGFARSMHELDATNPDFMMLNEVSRHSDSAIASLAPGFTIYRDPIDDRSLGGPGESQENAVLWRSSVWQLLDGGRVKIVDNDMGFLDGKAFTWDRYATWTVLRRTDGAVVSVISVHMMTNPTKAPRQHGHPGMSRVTQYGRSAQILVSLVHSLEQYGPVLVGGDMNSHPNQGSWTAAGTMGAAGYSYAKDSGVMYQFVPPGVTIAGDHQFGIVSDHPALATTLNMNGVKGSGNAPLAARAVRKGARLPSGPELTAAMLSNAHDIIVRGRAARLPREAWVDAIAASLAETGLRNRPLKHGMVGIFAQRPSRGWGGKHRLHSPDYAANSFFGTAAASKAKGLVDYPWRTMSMTDSVGAVLGAVFPEKFASRVGDAQFLTQYLLSGGRHCGQVGLGRCPKAKHLTTKGTIASSAQAMIRCVHHAFPQAARYVGARAGHACESGRLVAGVNIPLAHHGKSALSKSAQRLGRGIVHYLQINGVDLGVNFVVFHGQTWAADDPAAGWRPYVASDGSRSPAALVEDRVYVAMQGGAC